MVQPGMMLTFTSNWARVGKLVCLIGEELQRGASCQAPIEGAGDAGCVGRHRGPFGMTSIVKPEGGQPGPAESYFQLLHGHGLTAVIGCHPQGSGLGPIIPLQLKGSAIPPRQNRFVRAIRGIRTVVLTSDGCLLSAVPPLPSYIAIACCRDGDRKGAECDDVD